MQYVVASVCRMCAKAESNSRKSSSLDRLLASHLPSRGPCSHQQFVAQFVVITRTIHQHHLLSLSFLFFFSLSIFSSPSLSLAVRDVLVLPCTRDDEYHRTMRRRSRRATINVHLLSYVLRFSECVHDGCPAIA